MRVPKLWIKSFVYNIVSKLMIKVIQWHKEILFSVFWKNVVNFIKEVENYHNTTPKYFRMISNFFAFSFIYNNAKITLNILTMI